MFAITFIRTITFCIIHLHHFFESSSFRFVLVNKINDKRYKHNCDENKSDIEYIEKI
jgi:hypothetical protein